ncbi:MAG: flagellar hook assembly protein FlgD [Hahellaceae bacterium]|nr:flagellar hook assembly protein FlgD [Hahellaceae bacterium]
MATYDSVSSAGDVLSNYALQTQQAKKGNELGKNEFMELMVAQLNNQNPLEPQDNGEFISQLAQFSSLEEMQKVSGSVDTFATQYRSTQALQASAMVGRSVLVNTTSAPLGVDGRMSGVVDLASSTSDLKLSVYNGSGELIRTVDMGQQIAGQVAFEWDGKNEEGQSMPSDTYTIKADARYDGNYEQVSTLLSSNVDSVSIAKDGGITLNLASIGAIPLNQVRQIN